MGLMNLPTQMKVRTVTIRATGDYIGADGTFRPGLRIFTDTVRIDDEDRLRQVLAAANSRASSEAARDDRRNVTITVEFTSVPVPIEEVLPVGGDSTITWTA